MKTIYRLMFLMVALCILASCAAEPSDSMQTYDPISSTASRAPNETGINTESTPAPVHTAAKAVTMNNKSRTINASDFKGSFSGLVIKDKVLAIESGSSGTFDSLDINLGESFTRMLISWNATSNGGKVEILASVKKADDTYSDWYSYGVWSSKSGVSSSNSKSDSFATMDIDTLMLKKESTGTVRFRVVLTKTASGSPVLRSVTIATNKASGALTEPKMSSVLLSVPLRKQMTVPDIGGRICSPTSLSMILEYYNIPAFETIDTCNGVYDNVQDIYGNWLFNVAYAGEKGFTAYVDIYDSVALRAAIAATVPVACSIKVKAGQLSGSGYPDYATNGHIIVVIGYKNEAGKDYFIINDPYFGEGNEKLQILASELETVWNMGVVYVVLPEN